MKIIELLTAEKGRKIFMNVDNISSIVQGDLGGVINGVIQVQESPAKVATMMLAGPYFHPEELDEVGRSDQQIVDLANALARKFYALRGYEVKEGYRFDRATHPHEVEAWSQAVAAFDLIAATDVHDALASLDE